VPKDYTISAGRPDSFISSPMRTWNSQVVDIRKKISSVTLKRKKRIDKPYCVFFDYTSKTEK
jgi:hypothetical protein